MRLAKCSARPSAEKQSQLPRAKMIRPSVYGQAIIILVYVPLLTFQGVEGRMFTPMAVTVILALLFAFLLSLTVVPAAIALWLSRPVDHAENKIDDRAGQILCAVAGPRAAWPALIGGAAAATFVGSLVLFQTLGQEFLPTLDEQDVLLQVSRIPGTSVDQSQAMQFDVEKAVGKVPEVKLVFRAPAQRSWRRTPCRPTKPIPL
jgi:cobalt-zinc-cadmium resistance protein CzcA